MVIIGAVLTVSRWCEHVLSEHNILLFMMLTVSVVMATKLAEMFDCSQW
jgi:hypothetical protein